LEEFQEGVVNNYFKELGGTILKAGNFINSYSIILQLTQLKRLI